MGRFSLPYVRVRFFNLKTYVCLQLYENPVFCDFLYSDSIHIPALSPTLTYPHAASGSAFFHLCLVVLHSGKTPALHFSFHSFPLNLALKLCAPEVIVRSPACLRLLLYIQKPSVLSRTPDGLSLCEGRTLPPPGLAVLESYSASV